MDRENCIYLKMQRLWDITYCLKCEENVMFCTLFKKKKADLENMRCVNAR